MKLKILVGSKAAKTHIPSFRDGSDTDVFSTHKQVGLDSGVVPLEILFLFEEKSQQTGVATLNDLLTIKLSHLTYDIFWHKHMSDYLVFKKYGAIVNQKLYVALQQHWKEVHGNKSFISLYKTKDSFFDDFVKKEYDHDTLHELVAHPNKPVYTSCLKDGQEVAIDRLKFEQLPFKQQVKMFREEINVIACERWLIPTKDSGIISFRQAYSKSLHKTVTALTKSWASRFICENLEEFIRPNRSEVGYLFNHCKLKV